MKKILIITLHVNEPQLENLCNQIKIIQEIYPYDIRHVIISGLSALEAMIKLYKTALILRNDYDVLIKIDADMNFNENDSLQNILQLFEKNGMPRLTISVFDCILGVHVYGVHIIDLKYLTTNADITEIKRDDWFVNDHAGLSIYCNKKYILHCNNYSKFQAYSFGYNRGLKTKFKKQNFYYVLLLMYKNNCLDGVNGFIDGLLSNDINFNYNHVEKLCSLNVNRKLSRKLLSILFLHKYMLLKSILITIQLCWKNR